MTDIPNFLWTISWQTAVLAAAVWLVTRAARRAPASWRHALWALVLIKFLVPPFAYLPESLAVWQRPEPAAVSSLPAPQPQRIVTPEPAAVEVQPTFTTAPTPTETAAPITPEPSRAPSPAAILTAAWLLGACTAASTLLLRLAMQRKITRRALPVSVAADAILADCASAIRVKRLPLLMQSPHASTPMLVDIFKPTILLPMGLTETSPEPELRAILLHELAHVRRRDMLVLWLQHLVAIAFYFNPALWLVARELKRERELACDELVLSTQTITRQAYAAGYLSALKMAAGTVGTPVSLAMAEPFEVERNRLTSILSLPIRKLNWRWVVGLLVVCAVGLPTYVGIAKSSRETELAGPPASAYRINGWSPAGVLDNLLVLDYASPPSWESDEAAVSVVGIGRNRYKDQNPDSSALIVRVKKIDMDPAYSLELGLPASLVTDKGSKIVFHASSPYLNDKETNTFWTVLRCPLPPAKTRFFRELRGNLRVLPETQDRNWGPISLPAAQKPNEIEPGLVNVAVRGWGVGDSPHYRSSSMHAHESVDASHYYSPQHAADGTTGYLNVVVRSVSPDTQKTGAQAHIVGCFVYDAGGRAIRLTNSGSDSARPDRGLPSEENEGYYGFVMKPGKSGEAVVLAVDSKGPAWEAGLREGDVITRFLDYDVSKYSDISVTPSTSRLPISVLRNGTKKSFTIVPESRIQLTHPSDEKATSWAALKPDTSDPRLAQSYNTDILTSTERVPKSFVPVRIEFKWRVRPPAVKTIPFTIRNIPIPKEFWNKPSATKPTPEREYAITPGTYKLKWTNMPDFRDPAPRHGLQRINSPGGGPDFTGHASGKAHWGQLPRWVALLDESKGTGKGYDTLYLFSYAGGGYPRVLDTRRAAIRVALGPFSKYGPLKERSRVISFDDSPPSLVPVSRHPELASLTIGTGASTSTRQTALDIRVRAPSDPPKDPHVLHIGNPWISIREESGWVGQVETSAGPRYVSTVDSDGDGRYNESGYDSTGKYVRTNDTVVFERRANQALTAPVGHPFDFAGGYYTVSVSPDGSTLTVRSVRSPASGKVAQPPKKQPTKPAPEPADPVALVAKLDLQVPCQGMARRVTPDPRKIPIAPSKAHSGTDFAAPTGTPIVAAASGKVIEAGWHGAYGNLVIIDHGDGITSLYGHCSKINVTAGTQVKKGDEIAKVGSTGYSTGPHLHFELRANNKPIQPSAYKERVSGAVRRR